MSNQTFILNGVDVLGELERLKSENEKYRQALIFLAEYSNFIYNGPKIRGYVIRATSALHRIHKKCNEVLNNE